MFKQVPDIIKEHAKITHRNFAGKPTTVNPVGGKRGFSLIIEDAEDAAKLIDEGWYVKQFKKARNEGEEPEYFLPVQVSFKAYAPKIYIVNKDNFRLLREDECDEIDKLEIANIDLTIRPYCWEVRGESGIAAYLKTMYITIVEDAFADKYPQIYGNNVAPAPDTNEEAPW